MKDLKKILEIYRGNAFKNFYLATIVQTCGSSYRKSGARMLIGDGNHLFGSISGGCLETDLIARAQNYSRTDKPVLLKYDTSTEEDVFAGTGLGCNGSIDILLEPLHDENSCARQMDFLEKILSERQTGVIATVIYCEGATHHDIGDRLSWSSAQASRV